MRWLLAFLFILAPVYLDYELNGLRYPSSISEAPACQVLLSKAAKPNIEMIDFNPEMKAGIYRLGSLQEASGADPSIYLGIANNSSSGTHHYYLVAGNKRFDGMPLFSKSIVKKFHSEKDVLLSKGVVFKMNVPREVVEKLNDAFELKPHSFSCLHAACKVLKKAGISIDDIEKQLQVRTKRISAGLLAGEVNLNGLKLSPEDQKFYFNSQQEFDHFLHMANTTDSEQIGQMVMLLIPVGGLGVLVVYATTIVINSNHHP